MDTNSSNWWVAPFGYLRVLVYLQLTVAFRCSSRPSSSPSAKASTVHSYFLNLTNIYTFDKYYSIFKDLLNYNYINIERQSLSKLNRTDGKILK